MPAPTTLEQRITARLHESIGDLVTEEDLRQMVTRGMDEALFKPRLTPRQYGGYDQSPSLVDAMVTKHLGDRMTAAIEAWIAANPAKMEAAVESTLQAGVATAVLQTLDKRFAWVFESLVSNMKGQGLLQRGPNG